MLPSQVFKNMSLTLPDYLGISLNYKSKLEKMFGYHYVLSNQLTSRIRSSKYYFWIDQVHEFIHEIRLWWNDNSIRFLKKRTLGALIVYLLLLDDVKENPSIQSKLLFQKMLKAYERTSYSVVCNMICCILVLMLHYAIVALFLSHSFYCFRSSFNAISAIKLQCLNFEE